MSEHSTDETPLIPAARRSAEQRPWAQVGAAQEDRVTSRARRLVQGLPDWEPLPPGEILVRRPSQA